MTREFVEALIAELKCPHCKCGKVPGKSLCSLHLKYAKDQWYARSVRRRAEGLCCYCDKPNFNGGVRCEKHAAYNKKKCKAWSLRNPGSSWTRAKNYTSKTGNCYHCSEHNPVRPGSRLCQSCVDRANARKRAKRVNHE